MTASRCDEPFCDRLKPNGWKHCYRHATRGASPAEDEALDAIERRRQGWLRHQNCRDRGRPGRRARRGEEPAHARLDQENPGRTCNNQK